MYKLSYWNKTVYIIDRGSVVHRQSSKSYLDWSWLQGKNLIASTLCVAVHVQ